MYVLGIETSCDETAAAILKDGKGILSNEVSSSLKFHRKYGGVVPEIAFRIQLAVISEVVDKAVKEARLKLKNIGLISVTTGPGLLGSLLVGISFAKGLGLSLDIPLLGVNHLHGHIYASFLQPKKIQRNLPSFRVMPFVALVVSGGHTSLFYVKDFDKITVLGATLDDACGEVFDKVGKILGLGYPGGPFIERLARNGDPRKIRFHCSRTHRPLDFSFSGIKTAVLYYVKRHPSWAVRHGLRHKTQDTRHKTETLDTAASFQEAVIDVLVKKSFLACKLKKTNHLVIGGGVVANSRLRQKFYEEASQNGINVYFPPKELCMDNAAMIAGLGYRLFKKGYISGLNLTADLN